MLRPGSRGKARLTYRKDIGVADWADYEKDPEKLREDWNAAVRNAIYELLRAAKNAK